MSDAEKFRAALERDPTDTQAFVNLCDLTEREGDFEYLAELYKYRAQVIKDNQEIADLFRIVDRDLADAGISQVSTDRRFMAAYNAALQLATIALHCAGYRAAHLGHHRTAFAAVPFVMGAALRTRAKYFDRCRRKRNSISYDRAGQISGTDVNEIVKEAEGFKCDVLNWLEQHYPEFVPDTES